MQSALLSVLLLAVFYSQETIQVPAVTNSDMQTAKKYKQVIRKTTPQETNKRADIYFEPYQQNIPTSEDAGRCCGLPLTAQSVTTLPWDGELLQLLKELVEGQQNNPVYQQLLADPCAFLGPSCLTTYLPSGHRRCYIVPHHQFLLPPCIL